MKKVLLVSTGIVFFLTVAVLVYFIILSYNDSKMIETDAENKPAIGLALSKNILTGLDSWQYVLMTQESCDQELFTDRTKILEANLSQPPQYDEGKVYCLRQNDLTLKYSYLILDANQPKFAVKQSPEDFLQIKTSNQGLTYAYRPLSAAQTCQANSFADNQGLKLREGQKIAISKKDYNTDYCFRSTNEFIFHAYLKLRIKYPTFLSAPSFRLTQNSDTIAISKAQESNSLDHLNDWQYVVSEQNLGCWGHLFKTMTPRKGRGLKLNEPAFNKHYCFRAFNSTTQEFEYEYLFANKGLNHQKSDGSTSFISPLIVNLAERMQLTDLGKSILYDSLPIIYDDAAAFEKCCGQGNGYYDGQRIHLRGPTIPKIRAGHTSSYGWYESVAAHELMHAVLLVEGLPKLRKIIEPYYDFKDIFINHYTFGHLYEEFEFWQVISEVHSVIIQKAVDLPPELDEHYNRYFKNRHLIRNFDALSGFTDVLPPAKTP